MSRRTNQLILETARGLYLKYGGEDHRRIEREMHALGCLGFSRRVFYDQKSGGRSYPGWIKKYKWNEQLEKGSRLPDERRPKARVVGAADGSNSVKNGHRSQDIREHSCSFVAKTCDAPRLGGSAVENTGPPTANTQPPGDFTAWLKRISPSFHWDWPYQQLIYEQLRRVTAGESKRLMIFIPPRHGKSELVTVRYAVWRLLNDPSINVILGSYNQRLANRFSRRVRITWEDSLQMHNAGSEPPVVAGGWNSKDTREHSCSFTANDAGLIRDQSPFFVANESPRPGVSAVRSSRNRLNTVAEWETGLGGGVRAVGVGGGITGFGANLVIIDDPVRSRAEAESKTYRERVYDWFNDDLYTRLEPNAAIILIQTRWHEDDLAGRLLKDMHDGGEHWDVISLPALAEGSLTAETHKDLSEPGAIATGFFSTAETTHRENEIAEPSSPPRLCVSAVENNPGYAVDNQSLPEGEQPSPKINEIKASTGEDPSLSISSPLSHSKNSPCLCVSAVENNSDLLNRKPGEALCPDRFTRDDLLRIQTKLGSYSFSALYQQRPTPPEGGLFKRAWFSRVIDRPPAGLRWVRGYDLAVSTRDTADYTASFRCALDKQTGDLYIADGFRRRIEFPEQRRYIVDRIQKEPGTEHGIEQALHGQAFIQDLRREHRLFGRAFRGIKVTGDKFTRALSWANLAEEGKVVLVRGPWIDAFLEEVCSFPNSRHDDQLDAVSLAVEMLQRHSFRSHGF
jgi:predicted phage terminase large subunit-like protein